jgi:O-methyltransferase
MYKEGTYKYWQDTRFQLYVKHTEGRTLIDIDRLFMIYQACNHVYGLKGSIAEVGVYKGGSAKMIHELLLTDILHLFDTFEGMPETDQNKDLHKKGDFNDTSLESVKSLFGNSIQVVFHKGLFPQSVPDYMHYYKFKFVHVDVDIYESTKSCLEFFYPRLISGGILICDDYGFDSCPGCKQAVDEFMARNGIHGFYLPTGQFFIIK